MTILLQSSRQLMKSILTFLFLKKIPKSILNILEAISANNNSNQVDVLETKEPLLLLENTTFQQLLQLTDLLVKIISKCVANLILTINPALFVVRTQMLNIFDSMDLQKLSSFLSQCQLHFCTNLGQFSINATKMLGVVYTRRQKSMKLAQKCAEYVNSVKRVQ